MQLEKLSREPKGGIIWVTTIVMAIFHIGAVIALFNFSWSGLWLLLALWWIGGSLGIGIGYHRLLTHRGFKCPKWLEYFFTVCATLALEGGPISWVATHRIHHQNSDQEGDPHTPRDGKWWAHIGWVLIGKAMHHDATTLAHYVPDLAKDRFHVWMTKLHWVPLALLTFTLYAIGGWNWVLWGIFLRTILSLHFTWMVNSITHIWGSRRFKTRDDSTNNFWVALVTFGEGWHNNHHAHPTSARHGIRWYEIDTNWYCIKALSMLGLITNVKALKWPLPANKIAPAVAPAAATPVEVQGTLISGVGA